ncbi:hypothetical protein O4H61_16980 [Roseovarius aestuarii]|nr:hypothetical protein [Roseovarius aestuarii]
MALTPIKTLMCAGMITTLTACGLFRTDFPVRNGPQAEPHVTYVVTGTAKSSQTDQPSLEEESE